MLAFVLPFVLLGSMIPLATASAAPLMTVTPATGGSSISADTNSAGGTGAYATLSGPSIHEGSAGDLATGSIVLNRPAGFQFNVGSASAAAGGAGCAGMVLGPVVTTATTVTIPIATASSAPCTVTVSGLQVRPTAGNPLASGKITNIGTTGPTGPKSYGTLTEVEGAPVLTFTSGHIANTTDGAALTPSPVFHDQDAWGNNRSGDSVQLAIKAGTGATGAVLTCATNPRTTGGSGNVTFNGCSIDKPGIGYVLRATTGATAADTTAFTITTGPATRLAFIVQPPATASSGTPFPGTIQVAITDAGGNVVTAGITATIALTIGTNPGAGTLSCTGGTSATTVNGVATFTGCAIAGSGNGYTLVATATATAPVTSLARATSTAINLTSVAPVISITTSPALNGATPPTAVIAWGHDVTLMVHFGGNGANRAFELQVTRDQLTWNTIAHLTTNAAGDASFVYGPSDNRYYRAVFAGASGLSAGTSPTVRVVVRSIILLRPTSMGAVERIAHGTAVTFTATARPNRPELPQARADFVVYRLTSSGWVKVLDQVVPVDRGTGVAALRITFSTMGKFYVRAQLVPTPVNANSGWTPIERYDVV